MNTIINQFTTKWSERDHITYTAEKGLNLVGTCMVSYDGVGKKDALLWNLQVDVSCRKQGIAKKFINRACEDAAARGCKEITLEWGAMDSDGWIFDWYKRLGFVFDCHTHRSVRMKKCLTKKKK